MYFEIASRGKQMVSKEGLKNWHQFWVSICVFGGPNFGPPNSIEACFRAATEMAPIGSKNGAVGRAHFGATFCEQFGLVMTSAARTKRKKCDPKKLKLGRPK